MLTMMPPRPTMLNARPAPAPPAPGYLRSYATSAESDALAKLLDSAKSPFYVKGTSRGANSMDGVKNRLAVSTLTGMADEAARQGGLPGGHIRIALQPPESDQDNRSFLWASSPQNYGITIRPGYLGSPQGLDATVRHEVAHASDLVNNPNRPFAHGPTFRDQEAAQYVPHLSLMPQYSGTDYAGKDEYADKFADTGDKRYVPHVFMSDFDNPQQAPYRVNVKDIKGATDKNLKALIANLRNPPVPKNTLGPATRRML